MKGRSRLYRRADPTAAGQFLSVGSTTSATSPSRWRRSQGGDQKARAAAVLACLNSERLLRWGKVLLL
jgi:hypothetical protein